MLVSLSLLVLVAFSGFVSGLKPEDCKCRLNDVDSRIVGGKKVNDNKYPWHASVSISGLHKKATTFLIGDDTKDRDHVCNAIIINENFVLTSANCIDYSFANLKDSQMSVGVGSTDLRQMFDNGKIGVKRKIVYPLFNSFGTSNDDIALLELESPLKFTSKVAPACLGLGYRSEPENILKAIGHGYEDGHTYNTKEDKFTGGTISRFLREADVKDISTLECKKEPTLICTKSVNKENEFCDGDYGSGLQSPPKNGKTFVLGVLRKPSFITADGDIWNYCKDRADYQRISNYFSFIKFHAKETCTDAGYSSVNDKF